MKPFWGKISDEVDEKLCFVLMPFSPPKLTDIYKRYVKTPVQELGMRCERADDISKPGVVMTDIWAYINRAAAIVAELTDRNANVFYELGMAHVLGKDVISIRQSGTDIPFNVHGVRHIIYDDGPEGYDKLATDIKRALKAVLDEREEAKKTPPPATAEAYSLVVECVNGKKTLKQTIEFLRQYDVPDEDWVTRVFMTESAGGANST
jgi:hypothetical protein